MMSTLKYLLSGLILLGLVSDVQAHSRMIHQASPIYLGPISIQIRSGSRALPTFTDRGSVYVLGSRGLRYSIWVKNRTRQRLEIVASVDGRDVITGVASRSFTRRGYILNPYRYVDITGFRTSRTSVAAFRFTTRSRSYAAKMGGSWFKIGHIHIAVFRERHSIARIPHRPIIQFNRRDRRLRKRLPQPSGASRQKMRRKGKALSPSNRRRWHRRSRHYRPGLGTAYGGRRYAPSRLTTFVRASSVPSHRVTIRYNNCAGFRRAAVCSVWCPCYRRYRHRYDWYRKRHNRPLRRPSYAPPPPSKR